MKNGKRLSGQKRNSSAVEAAIRDAKMITMKGRRVGILYFNTEDVETNPEMFATVLSRIRFLPIRVECRMDYEKYELTGLSAKFERIPNGDQVPVYRIDFSKDGTSVKAVKIG